MTEKKKGLSFGGGLLIYITVMLTLIFVALAVWWHYLGCYEASRYDRVMDRYMTETLQSELEEEIAAYADAHATGYQTRGDIIGVLSEALSGDAWRYELSRDGVAPKFLLYCGDIYVGEAVMKPGEENPLNMGFIRWDSPDAAFDFSQFGRTIHVTVPYGCQVLLSGEAISEDLVVETIGLYPQLEAYEALITQPNQLLVYEIGELFAEVAVEYGSGYVALKSDAADSFYALPACEDHMAEQLIEYCKGFVQAHVNYTANAESLWVLQQYLVTDSALYQQVTEASSGLDWNNGVNAVVQTIDIKNFTYYGNVITCDASYITTRDDGDRSETMRILLVNTDIGWRVIHIEV